MKVWLTRKHADRLDGIDLSKHRVGDVLDLPAGDAQLIIAEEWAVPDRRFLSGPSPHKRRADDRPAQGSRFRLPLRLRRTNGPATRD